MTDKTKILPCPFCGAEAEATDEMFGSVIHCKHLHTCPLDGHEKLAAAVSEWSTRYTPAEDVRALVNEPVAWADPDSPGRMCTAEHKAYAIEIGGAPASALITLTVPLYRQAQRKTVMPERMTMRPFQTVDRGSTNYKAGWNAYDDEFTRLNL